LLLSQLLAAPINHVLRAESWALRRLSPYAGRTAALFVAPFSLTLMVRESGEVAAAPPAAVPDVHISASLPAAMRILAGDERAYDEVRVQGDGEFAQAIRFVVQHARWDVEEDLARIFGDALAHRAVQTGRMAMQVPARALSSLAQNLSDYWVEERPLIARRDDVARWVQGVDRLRDDVERLAQRIERL
jgi:ubiquinone biosynthesis protein UbiJ